MSAMGQSPCYNRFVRWRQAGVWDRIMGALAASQDTAVQMIDTSVVRVTNTGPVLPGTENSIWAARATNYLAFIKLASNRIWLRAYESTP
jgi:transposase